MQALEYAGSPIRERDDFLCLTDMWKAAGADPNKRPYKWLKQDGPREFISFLADTFKGTGEPFDVFSGLVVTEKGGQDPATWAHWQIGLAYAKYLSPEFHAWCNEVVRDHMEGRRLPVQAVQGAITLSEEALNRFADRIGEGAVRAAREFLAEDVRRTVEPRFDRVEKRLIAIEEALPKRRYLSEATKREHVNTIDDLGSRCPCCGTATVVADGVKSKFAEFDHFYQNSHPGPDHTWLICQPCHTELSSGRVTRDQREAAFRAYQDKRRRLPGRQTDLF